ncbi:MAG: endolytic transglycosylase MltG [Parcubacteria group bacterium]|nr:endolytic transglycosylase MltG [Parcubacteria group bacterium]
MFNNLKFLKLRLALALLAVFSLYLVWEITRPQFILGSKEVAVAKGDNFIAIASKLRSAGVIKSSLAFMVSAVYRGSFATLKAGQYVFEPGLSLRQIISRIENGEAVFGSDEVVVAIPEGLTLAGIVSKLNELGFENADAITKIKAGFLADKFDWLGSVDSKFTALEGFLFPDTYRFSKNADTDEIVIKMLNRFGSKTADVRAAAAASGRDFYQTLIMASILEKEVPPPDMPLAAGVLWQRLAIGMPLQADATLVYELGRPIKRSDTTELNSPYNTYKYQGLPPTPIANPGLAALNAALYPRKSNYLYYLTRSADKVTVFSETLEEHNLAKARY